MPDMPASEVAEALVVAVQTAAERLERGWAAYWAAAKREGVEGDWRRLVGPAAAFGDLRGLLKRMGDEAAEEIGRGMRDEKDGEGHSLVSAIVESVGHVARHTRAMKQWWDVDGLRSQVTEVLQRRLVDERQVMCDTDGVILTAPEAVKNAVARTVEEVVEACGQTPSASWKVGKLTALGIDAKDYKSQEWGGFDILITPGVGVGVDGAREDDARAEDNYDERQG